MKTLTSPATRQFVIYMIIIIAVISGCWFVYTIRDILVLFFLACFSALLLSPFVDRLRRWKCPELVGIILTFLSVFLIVSLFLFSIIPLFVTLAEDSKEYVSHTINLVEEQARNNFPFLQALPSGIADIVKKGLELTHVRDVMLDTNRNQIITNNLLSNIDTLKNFIQKGISQASSLGISVATGVTSFIINISLYFLLTFFVILERRALLKWFFGILPSDIGKYFKSREHRMSQSLHAWLRGQIFLALFMFAINFIGLHIAHYFGLPVKNIFSLALIAGAMEFVPYAGPIITFVVAFLTVLVSPDAAWGSMIGVTVLYIIFQQLEGNVMVPMVMSRTLSLSSLYILIVTIIGGTLGGPLGVLFAIPLASIVHIFYHDWMHYRRAQSLLHPSDLIEVREKK